MEPRGGIGVEQAVANLVYAYAERIDAGDFAGVADLLAHAEVTTEGMAGVTRGRDDVLALYQRTTRLHEETGTPRTHHVTTNLAIELGPGGDAASARSKYTVFQQTPKLPLQPIIAGRYHDRFERVGGAWRFCARHIFCDHFGDLSQHLLFDAAAIPRN
ncbi:MAG: nuclear transport factor 2 family protein [Myxococcota bacterium]